jgi:hypothetical protein
MTEPTQHAESVASVMEEAYRPRLVAEMRMHASSPFTRDADRPFWNRMAELFATKPWDECVAVYLGASEQSDGGAAR